jgi:hypothetical protein
MNRPITAMSALGIVSMIAATYAGAQTVSPRTIAPAPRMSPGPAPILSAPTQEPGSIWAKLTFQLPTNAVAIRVARQLGSATPVLLTPTAVPISSLARVDGLYAWTDASLGALGTYSYAVSAELSDGRVGNSTPVTFTPQIFEPTNVRGLKASPYSAVVEFKDGAVPAGIYRLYGTGLPAFGVDAKPGMDPSGSGTTLWSVYLQNLAAGTYNWVVRAEFKPGIRSNGVPVSVTLP